MVKIRMKRMGSKKKPFYRIVVADSRRARDGRFIEELGYYNPVSSPKQFKVNAAKAKEWIQNGAQPSTTVKKLFASYNVLETAEEMIEVNTVKVNKTETVVAKVEEEKVEEAEDNEEVEA